MTNFKNKPKIAFFLPVFKPGGGIHFLIHLANHLNESGYNSLIIVPKGYKYNISIPNNVPVSEVGFFDGKKNLLYYSLNVIMSILFIPKVNFIVGGHGIFAIIIFFIAFFRRAMPICLIQGDDFSLFVDHDKFRAPIIRFLYILILKISYSFPVCFIANSNFTKEIILKNTSREVIHILNPIVHDQFFNDANLVGHINTTPPYTIFMIYRNQTIKGMKNVETIVHYVNKIRHDFFQFVIASPDIVSLNLNADNVSVYTNPDFVTLCNLYKESDFFLFLSDNEGFGLPPAEAMASGSIVITTDTGGSNDFCHHNFNCLVLNSVSSKEILDCLILLIDNFNLRISLIANAYNSVKKYKVAEIGQKFVQILENSKGR